MSAKTVITIDPTNQSELKRFLSLERKLMQGYPFYISEIDDDVAKLLTGKSAMSKNLQLELFIVTKAGQDIGRCAAIINKKFQTEKQPGSGFIGFFAAAKDCSEEIIAMFESAENWLKARGVTKVIAPANGGAPQSMGFLATGYDEDPMFPFPWHPAYYKSYIENLDYKPTYPLWYYEIDFASTKYQEAKKKYLNTSLANIRTITKKNWDKDIDTLIDLLNECFKNEWEFTSLDYTFGKEFFGPMKDMLHPEQILFAEADGKPIGFCLAMPDLTPLFRTLNGKVGILDILKLMFGVKKFQRAGILGIGVKDEYKGKGISKAIALKLYDFHEKLGLKSSLYYPVNESNVESRGFAESIGGKGRMMYQVYDKLLS